MPQRRHQSSFAGEHLPPHFQRIYGNGDVKNPCQSDRRIQDKLGHLLPSSIRLFTLTFLGFLERFLISSILATTSFRSTCSSAGTISAASLPRRVIRIRSPRDARSTNSESFCFASNIPTVRIGSLLEQPR